MFILYDPAVKQIRLMNIFDLKQLKELNVHTENILKIRGTGDMRIQGM